MKHRVKICSPTQADQPGWDDRWISALRRVLDHPGHGVEDSRDPRPVPQPPQDTADQHLQA